MIKKIMYWFALTEGGARGVIRASVGCFFMYLAYMLPMLLLSYFVRGVVLNAVQGPVVYLVWMLLIAGIMYVFINFSYITTYNETYKESKNIRVHIAETLKRLPLSFFSKHDISDLSQTILQDVADMEHALGHAIPEAFGFGVFLVFISILLLGGNFILGLTIVVPVLLSLFMAMLTKRQQLLALEKFYHKKRETAEAFQESIELQQEIRSYGQKEAVKEKLCALLDEQEKEQLATEKAQVLPFSAITSLVKFSLGLTVLVGSMLFVRGEINIPYFVLYITASARIIDGLTGLYMNLAELLYIDTKSRRLRDLYNTPFQEGEDTEFRRYSIRLHDVSFSYNEDRKIIDRVSFSAGQNMVTALIGPSGCGKSTLLKLMSRLYDYDRGSIKINGRDIKEISTDCLFANVSMVFQDVALFNISVMENIRLGRIDAADEEVYEAARIANCHDFIKRLPEGYDTLIGENGMRLSGGERQRLSIARAILKNAPIVLLDEISASLDVENETRIQEGLRVLLKDKTVVIISHRMRSIQNADRIILLEEGRVSAEGSHEELLASSPLYRRMLEREQMTESFQY